MTSNVALRLISNCAKDFCPKVKKVAQHFIGNPIKNLKTLENDMIQLKCFKGLKMGEYGVECEASTPLKDFTPQLTTALIKRGKSTGISTIGGTIIKAPLDVPIATSGVGTCSMVYVSNSSKGEHMIFHMLPFSDHNSKKQIKDIRRIVKMLMPSGYDNMVITLGAQGTQNAAKNAYKALIPNQPNAKVALHHFSTKNPELVGHNGDVYFLPIKGNKSAFTPKYTCEYPLMDLESSKTIDEMNFSIQKAKRIYPELDMETIDAYAGSRRKELNSK